MSSDTPHSSGLPLRGILVLPFVIAWALPFAGFAALWATIAPRSFTKRKDDIIRCGGIGILKLAGIRLQESGRENLQTRPAIVMFNHVSVLDMALLAATWAGNSVILYKHEFRFYPLIGSALKAMQMIPIDRSNRKAAKQSLSEAARRVHAEKLGVYVAPEGTRSKHGRLLPFKKGPFHLVLDAKLPIIPIVFRGIGELVPNGSWLAHSGTIRVDYLEPIETEDWQLESLDTHIAQVRKRFLDYLPEA